MRCMCKFTYKRGLGEETSFVNNIKLEILKFVFQVTVLKKSDNYMGERSIMRLPADFKYAVSQGWSAVTETVAVGCVCVADD